MAQPLPASTARPHWTPKTPAAWLALSAALALSYWAAGLVGLAAAVGPGGTTAIWPATGWALGALLLWGWRALPGLVLGSLITDSLSNPGQMAMAVQLSAASILQWCVIRAVLADWWPRMQASGGRFALRYVLVVCLGCLVATTVGNAVLLSFGKLSSSDWAYAWLTWWVGDSAGMLLITPLMLMALHPGVRAHCVLNQAYPVLAIGVGLSLSGSFLVGHVERDARLRAQASDLRSLAQAVENQMALGLSDLLRLGALHYRIQLSETEFAQSARAIRTEHSWLSSLAYLARVTPEQRAALEEKLGQNLSSVQPDGSLHNAPSQSSYWVPLRLDPLGGQEARVGVDEGSDPLRRPAIEAALRTGRPALTPVLSNLHYAQDEPLIVLAYAPVFEAPDAKSAAEPTGLVSASLQLRDLLQTALNQFDRWQQPLLLLSDDSQPAGLLYDGHTLQDLPASAAHTALQTWLGQANLTQTIAFGSHRWTLRTPAQSADLRPSAVQAISLAIGLAFTALLTAFLIARSRRDEALTRWREELELQVQQRTQELAGTNQELRHEVLERQRMADQLRESGAELGRQQAQLRALLDHIPDPVWMKDLQGQYILVNPALERFFNQASGSLLGRRSADILPPDQAVRDRELDASALLVPGPIETENEAVDSAGKRCVHTITRAAVRNAEGERIGVLGVARDITKRLEREQVLQRFRWLADSADQGFLIADLDHTVVYLNDTAKRWLADTDWDEDGAPRQLPQYWSAATLAQWQAEVLPQLRERGNWGGELALQGLPGAQPPALLSHFFLMRDEQGQARYVAQLMTDISERLRLEKELNEARLRAEGANRAKSAFLANMSHEIRTPLNAVLGYAQLLREETHLPEGSRQRVQSIYSAGSRLLRLINDVLDLSKIEAGALQLHAERIDLRREIEDSVQLLQERARSAELDLSTEIDLPDTLPVLLDRGKFGQVLVNLLGNAIKFTPAGGQVRLQASLVDGDQLDLRIQDNGPGIAAAELSKLFVPFAQGDSGLKRGGTGLGLSLSRSLLRAMGGELRLSSEAGQGTCAWIELPLQRVQAPDTPKRMRLKASELHLAPDSPCCVLVVEDDPDSRELLVALLQGLGCQVLAAEHGAQALERCAQQKPDLILSDMRMPVMDGVELRRRIAADEHLSDIPMVAVTASSLIHEREAFLDMGFADFIAKPYDFDQILLMLRAHAGAQLVPRAEVLASTQPAPMAPSAPVESVSPAASAGPLDWAQALSWAQAGQAVPLRAWAAELPPDETALREAMQAALARYDLQAVEALLQPRVQTQGE